MPTGKSNPLLSTRKDRTNKNGTIRTLKIIKEALIPFMPYLIAGVNVNPAKTQALIGMSDHVNVPEIAISTIKHVIMLRRINPKKITALIFCEYLIFNAFVWCMMTSCLSAFILLSMVVLPIFSSKARQDVHSSKCSDISFFIGSHCLKKSFLGNLF